MNRIKSPLLILFISLLLFSCTKQEKVLVFSKTAGFRHSSIETGISSISTLLQENKIDVVATENAEFFTEETLKEYSAVIFLNTTGDILNQTQQADFERYIQAGGGFVGIHSATDTEYEWTWYNDLVGAYFNGHPKIQEATVQVLKSDDPICQHLPAEWTISEEWYNFKSINTDIEVLANLDESSYEGGTNGSDHPVIWKHQYDGGRSFYTALGHNDETFKNSNYLNHLLEGIRFAMGDNKLNYSKASTARTPEENRFSKKVLDFNLSEPMELDELDGRGIIYIERKGAVKLFDFETSMIVNLDTIPVHYADEDGLIGLAVDPDFKNNNWIYLFYSPAIDEAIQYVSRFTLENDKLTAEKVLLKIPLIRKCCHSGGSLEFGPDSLLYIGIGDNTNPFESAGFAPIDERENRQLFDAQRSAANTNDLRGKILRIKPENDGSYSIPEGNLFPIGTAKTRPEIYIMGCRNPFRFSIDSDNNDVYWGDVGPDAGTEKSDRGPAGMGEFNQAKKPGFYGWPYSRGNNQMYHDFNFSTKNSGEEFDPLKINNNSPNNTGISALPPIQESMIWYGYAKSNEFPWLGEGGVNPMSGPIYHSENYDSDINALPKYFENKWFIYEWMRDWVYLVQLDDKGEYVSAEQFMPSTEFSHPMDMHIARNGKLYILEYGQKWNSRNIDARLSEINYNSGNRAPVARFTMNKEVGPTPLTIDFSADKSLDYDREKIKYTWTIDEKRYESSTPDFQHTFDKPGVFDIELTVTDKRGEKTRTNKKIIAGNEAPKISIDLETPTSTYRSDRNVSYKINVSDLEDGSTVDSSIDPVKVKATLSYIPQGKDKILASIGHQQNTEPVGLSLINSSDCKACHARNEDVAGPSYVDIAKKYDDDDKEKLIHSTIKGSQGTWGETMMSAHPQLEIEEVEKMVTYILSLDQDAEAQENDIPLEGKLVFDQHLDDEEAGQYILMVSYLDNGNSQVEGSALSSVEEIIFKAPKFELESIDNLDKSLGIWESEGRTIVGSIKDGINIIVPDINLTDVKSISLGSIFGRDYAYHGDVELRIDNPNGKLIGKTTINQFNKDVDVFSVHKINIEKTSSIVNLCIAFRNRKNKDQYIANADWIRLNY